MTMKTSWLLATEARLGGMPIALTGKLITHHGRSGLALKGTMSTTLHGSVLARELQSISHAPLPLRWLSHLEVENLTVALDTAADSIQLQGVVELKLFGQKFHTQLQCSIQHASGKAQVHLGGKLRISDDVALELRFAENDHHTSVQLQWSDEQHPISLNELLSVTRLGDHLLPHGVDFAMHSMALSYNTATGDLCCSFGTQYGAGFVQHESGAVAVGFRFSGSRSLSKLPGIGAMLPDVSALEFEHLSFSYANRKMRGASGAAFPALPNGNHIDTSWFENQELVKGLWLGARLELNRSGHPTIRKLGALAGVDHLWLDFYWQPGSDVMRAVASLGSKLCLPGGHLGCIIGMEVPDFSLTMQSDAVSVAVGGTYSLSLFNHRLATKLKLSMSENDVDLAMQPDPANASIPGPAGIDIVLTDMAMEMGLELEPPSLTMGVSAKLLLGARKNVTAQGTVVMAMEGDAPDPLYLYGYLSELDLAQLVETISGQNISALQAFGLYHAFCSWCETPVQLPNGTTAQPGIAFGGGLQLFGFDAYCKMQVHGTRASRTITFSPVSVGNVLSLTGQGSGVVLRVDGRNQTIVQAGGPEFEMTPTNALTGGDFLSGSASLTLLGLDGLTAQVGISEHGMTLQAGINFNIVTSDLSATIDRWGKLNGSFNVSVGVSTSISAGIAGSIDLDTSVDGTVHIDAGPSGATVSVSGSFDFRGDRFSIGTIDLGSTAIRDIEGAIVRKTIDEAPHLLAHFISAAIDAAEQAAERAAEAAARAAREAAEAAAREARERAEQAAREAREQAEAAAREARERAEEAERDASRDAHHVEHFFHHVFSGW